MGFYIFVVFYTEYGIIRGMKLSRTLDRVLVILTFVSLVVVFGCLIKTYSKKSYAEGDVSTYETVGARFVTFYDEGQKLTVKTEAKTVGDALDRAGIIINSGDIVDPGIDSEINSDNYFINIHRARPVMIRDGAMEKYLMSASFDARKIAEEAGLTIYDGDEIKMVENTDFLEAGMVTIYEITRNGGRTLTVEEEIPFKEEKVKDYNLEPGKSEVRQLGEVGMKKTYYNVQYVNNEEVSREYLSEEVVREPVTRIVAEGASAIEQHPLTVGMGRNHYTYTKSDGTTVLRQETYYDLNMSVVIKMCGTSYTVREDGVKVDQDGYVLVAAELSRYPRCSVVETSLGPGKVYDTGGFAASNPEQFDLATDWTDHNGI